ncbi:hypothetical protein HZS_7344, partial [Henneguya salminicola]
MVMSGIKRRAAETTEIPSVISTVLFNKHRLPFKRRCQIKTQFERLFSGEETKAKQHLHNPWTALQFSFRTHQVYEVAQGQMEEFLLCDSGEQDKNQILLFGRQSNSEWSHLIEKLYVDETFSLAPALFSKIYVILETRGVFVLPIFYALLPNKEGRTYRRLKLAYEGLLRGYNTDHDFSFSPLFQIEGIDVAFEALENEIEMDLTPILNLFEKVYIGRQNRNRTRRRALFPPHMWSLHERTVNGEDRISYYVEAAHRRLQAEFLMDHPNIWKFIDGIRSVQNGR